MNALGFLKKHGVKVCKAVCSEAETSYEYFSQIAYGHRRPSVDMANKLVAASEKVVAEPTERLDFVSLLKPPEKAVASG